MQRQSPTALAVVRHCRERIAALQCDLERPRGPSETDLIRGRIAELRLLIDSIEPPGPHPAATVSPPPPYSL